MQDILRQSAYYSFVENGELEMNLAGDLIVNDYNDIEDKVIEFLDLYKNKKIKEFSFSPSKIYVYLKEYHCHILMRSRYNQILHYF